MTHSTQLSQLLLACLHTSPPPDLSARLTQLTEAEWQQLAALAADHRLDTLLYRRLGQHAWAPLAPAAVIQELQQRYRQNALQNLELYQGLAVVMARLQAAAIPVILLKGAVLAALVYEDAAMRRMYDLDLLVQREHVMPVAALLGELGYQPLTPLPNDQPLTGAEFHHLPRFVKPNAPAIEIHWTITTGRQSQRLDPAQLWQRAQPVTIADMQMLSLGPEDLLLHICCHATYDHQLRQGVRFLCDICALVQHDQATLQWPLLVDRATAWGWQRGVLLALFLAQQLLGAAIPDAVLHSLNPDQLSLAAPAELQAILFPEQLPQIMETSSSFLAWWQLPGLRQRVQMVGERVFLPRSVMSRLYPVAMNSPKLYWYYGVRVRDLLFRYTRQSWRAWRGAPEITTLLTRQEWLDRWLT